MLKISRLLRARESMSARQTLAHFKQASLRYPAYISGVGILLPLTILMHEFLPPLVIAAILNKLSNGQFVVGELWPAFGGLFVLYGLLRITSATIMWRATIVLVGKLEAAVAKDMAINIFGHLLHQSPDFHANHFGGSLTAQTTKYIAAYSRLAEVLCMQLGPLALGMLFTGIILVPKAPLFVAVLFSAAIVYLAASARGASAVRQISAEEAAAQSAQTGYLADSLSNILAVKSYAHTKHEVARFSATTEHTRQKSLAHIMAHNKRELYFSIATSAMTTTSLVLAVASVSLFGGNIATAFLVITYSTTLMMRLWQFSSTSLRTINTALGDAQDMTTLLATPAAILDPDKPQKPRIKAGHIMISNVTFRHEQTTSPLFKDFTLHIKPGEKVGIVGHSGAGKTTLTKLLMRFADIDAGTIVIDGQDITTITQADLRRHIAYVPQEPLLFHRSIRENIAYGMPGATETQIVAAARKTYAHNFIQKLPRGYGTLVGERGVKLSGGQRQRIAIARAILKDAPILVLDEATSALDSESEAYIQSALLKLIQKRTTLVVAHRLSTIQKMDRIVVLKDGAIAEEGAHSTLIRKKGVYAKLWARQLGEFLEN